MPLTSWTILVIAAVSSALALPVVAGELITLSNVARPFLEAVTVLWYAARFAAFGCDSYTIAARRSACSRSVKFVIGIDVARMRTGARSRFWKFVMVV